MPDLETTAVLEPSASSPVVNDGEPTTPETTQEQPETPEELSPADKRKQQLNAEIRRLIAQRDQVRREVSGQETRPSAESAPAPVEASKPVEPKSDDKNPDGTAKYPTWEDLRAAERKYDREMVRWELAEDKKKETAQTQQRSAAQSWSQKLSETETKHPDFRELVETNDVQLPIGSLVHGYLQEFAENPSDMLYELVKNPSEIERINKLPYQKALKELHILELSLTPDAEETEPGKAPETVTTRAPKPPTPITKPAATDTGLHDGLPTAEWVKRRNAQIARREAARNK